MTVTDVRLAKGSADQPDAYTTSGLTLQNAAKIFLGTFSARLLLPAMVIAAGLRLALGGYRWWDLGIIAIILASQPFTEWIVHVTVLHARPRTIGRLRIDPILSRSHRQHHADPKVLRLVLVPRQVMLISVIVNVPLYWLITPTWRLALTGLFTSYAMFVVYEWVHFLIHSSYRPKGWYYRYIWRAHRLHHFRNENYWFGVTIHLGDHALRTFPVKEAVPVSPTAFTLGVEVPAS